MNSVRLTEGVHALCVHSVSEIPPSMGGLGTCGYAPTTDCSL